MKKIVLGSSSEIRKRLLEQIGHQVDSIIAPNINEVRLKAEAPYTMVLRLAGEKLEACIKLIKENKQEDGHNIANSLGDDYVIICADSTAIVAKRLLEKHRDINLEREYLNLLSGRRHRFYTAIAIYDHKTQRIVRKVVETKLKFRYITKQEIEHYISTKQWEGCAGGYDLEGYASSFLQSINGSYSSVLGMPLCEVANILSSFGCKAN